VKRIGAAELRDDKTTGFA